MPFKIAPAICEINKKVKTVSLKFYQIQGFRFSLKMLQNCTNTQKYSVHGNFQKCNVNNSQSSCQTKTKSDIFPQPPEY